jgi:hypothetical protein
MKVVFEPDVCDYLALARVAQQVAGKVGAVELRGRDSAWEYGVPVVVQERGARVPTLSLRGDRAERKPGPLAPRRAQ